MLPGCNNGAAELVQCTFPLVFHYPISIFQVLSRYFPNIFLNLCQCFPSTFKILSCYGSSILWYFPATLLIISWYFPNTVLILSQYFYSVFTESTWGWFILVVTIPMCMCVGHPLAMHFVLKIFFRQPVSLLLITLYYFIQCFQEIFKLLSQTFPSTLPILYQQFPGTYFPFTFQVLSLYQEHMCYPHWFPCLGCVGTELEQGLFKRCTWNEDRNLLNASI